MKAVRWSLMEWIMAGPLPKRRSDVPGDAAAAGEGGMKALDAAAAKLEKERRQREKDQREREVRAERERVRQAADVVQDKLRSEEDSLRDRPASLAREFAAEEAPAAPATLAEMLWRGAAKTREKLTGGLSRIVLGRKEVDRSVLEEVEELLLTADMGPQTVERLIKGLQARLRRNELKDSARLKEALQAEIGTVLERSYKPPRLQEKGTVVVLFAGVNGTGKTTTIGKLGAQFRREGRKVLLVAGDTFRAAAAEQLEGWAERAQCDIFRQPEGSNPSGVVYQAVERALGEGYDLVLCDTAGRLHTKVNLMEELKKIKRVISKLIPEAPQETWLVLDANNGQNAIHQARDFNEAVGLSGLIVTKLDGTARGGVLVGIVNEFDLPVRYVGVGEGVDDLRPFDPQVFAASLFE